MIRLSEENMEFVGWCSLIEVELPPETSTSTSGVPTASLLCILFRSTVIMATKSTIPTKSPFSCRAYCKVRGDLITKCSLHQPAIDKVIISEYCFRGSGHTSVTVSQFDSWSLKMQLSDDLHQEHPLAAFFQWGTGEARVASGTVNVPSLILPMHSGHELRASQAWQSSVSALTQRIVETTDLTSNTLLLQESAASALANIWNTITKDAAALAAHCYDINYQGMVEFDRCWRNNATLVVLAIASVGTIRAITGAVESTLCWYWSFRRVNLEHKGNQYVL